MLCVIGKLLGEEKNIEQSVKSSSILQANMVCIMSSIQIIVCAHVDGLELKKSSNIPTTSKHAPYVWGYGCYLQFIYQERICLSIPY